MTSVSSSKSTKSNSNRLMKLRRTFLQVLIGGFFVACNSPLTYAQTNFFWNGASVVANPAAGGTGTWSTTNAWRTGTASGSQGTWTAATGGTNAGFLAGTAGTITLGTSGSTNFTGSSLTVQTNGYTITTSSSSRNAVFTGALSLANNVGLTLTNSGTGGNLNSFGSITFGTSSSLQIQGGASVNNANRVNLTGGGSTISGGSITLAGTGPGVTGFVSTASIASGGVNLNTNILNNSGSSATMLGATSDNLLNYGGVVSGSANLQISAGQSGGAGITMLSGANTYTANTYLNAGTNHVTRIGVSNTLPSGTTVFFGASAGGGTADNGGSIDLNGRDLAVGGLQKSANPSQGIANNTNDLSTLTIGKASGTNTFSGIIGTVTNSNLLTQSNNIAVVKTGGSTQILSGVNTYTGTTTVLEGTLDVTGSIASPIVSVSSGATLNSAGGITLTGGTSTIDGSTTGTGAITVADTGVLTGVGTIGNATTVQADGTLSPGSSPGAVTFTNGLTLNSDSVFEWDLFGNVDSLDGGLGGTDFDFVAVTGGALTIQPGATAKLIPGGTFAADSYWDSNREWNVFSFTGTAPTSLFNTDLGSSLVTALSGRGSFSWSTSGSNVVLNYTAVPEPTSLVFGLGLSVAGIVAYRRRKSKKVAAPAAAE
jgi:fibronectin-binding autotransporter adhesin